MTAKMFSRINSCELRHLEGKTWGAFEGQVCRATTQARNEATAAFLLAEEILRQNRSEAMRRDGYRCVRCGSMRNLQAHHKVHRGMGGSRRNDRVGNLETLCGSLDSGCHQKEHGG